MHRVSNASEKIDSFLGRLLFFLHISVIFCTFCLVVKGFFVYLHIVKGNDTISYPLKQMLMNYKYYVMHWNSDCCSMSCGRMFVGATLKAFGLAKGFQMTGSWRKLVSHEN